MFLRYCSFRDVSFRSCRLCIHIPRRFLPEVNQPKVFEPRLSAPFARGIHCLVLSCFVRTHSPILNVRRGFLREVANAGRSAGLRPGPLASFACDSLCFQETPWEGSVYSYTSTNTIVGASDRSSGASGSWQDHREVFRAVLGSFVSATR